MIEDELGAMAKRIASMAEDRCSDHAVGAAVLLLAEMAMNAVIGGLSSAKRMDIIAAKIGPITSNSKDYSAHGWREKRGPA